MKKLYIQYKLINNKMCQKYEFQMGSEDLCFLLKALKNIFLHYTIIAEFIIHNNLKLKPNRSIHSIESFAHIIHVGEKLQIVTNDKN